ncbi:MAG: hypothetical protein QW688_07570, partial [Thermoprotei archaeon]
MPSNKKRFIEPPNLPHQTELLYNPPSNTQNWCERCDPLSIETIPPPPEYNEMLDAPMLEFSDADIETILEQVNESRR